MSRSVRLSRRGLLLTAGAGVLAACSGPLPSPVLPAAQGCRVQVDDVVDQFTQEQASNAAVIVGEAQRRGLPPRASTIGLVTAMQESSLRNLSHGDRDSVGLFQQRPSQGWGTVEQIMDPWYASGKFYEALVQVPGWEQGDINDVAQAVQRSGVPEGYRKHEPVGRAWASALTGHDPAAVSSVDRQAQPSSPTAMIAYLTRVWPQLQIDADSPDSLTITTGDTVWSWSVAQLALLRGSESGLAGVRVGEQELAVGADQFPAWTGTPAPNQSRVLLQFRAA